MDWLVLWWYPVVGALAGLGGGLFGIGGGVIIVPFLLINFAVRDFPEQWLPHMALGTSLMAIAVTALAATLAHHRRGAVDWSAVRQLGPAMAVGVVGGSLAAAQLDAGTLRTISLILLAILAVSLLFERPPFATTEAPSRRAERSAVGGVIGFLSAFAGIGGGSLTVPYLHWRRFEIQRAVAVSAACGLFISIGGTIGYSWVGQGVMQESPPPLGSIGFVYLPAVVGLALGGLIAAPLGVALAHRLPGWLLRTCFAALLLGVVGPQLWQLLPSGPWYYRMIDPVALRLGPLQVHWYGLMYGLSFLLAWWLIERHYSRQPGSPLRPGQIDDALLWLVGGVIIGGRVGYVLLYGFEYFLREPLWLFAIHTGGMSFHGGLIGVLLAAFLYSRRHGVDYLRLLDILAQVTPLGLFLGRIGNFINQELWGRVTGGTWGLIFERDALGLIRHPSQLYEALLEGGVLFVLLHYYAARRPVAGSVAACFVLGYGSLRFAVEFYRAADAHIGFDLFGWMSRGQLLSVLMVALGLAALWCLHRRHLPSA